MGDPRNANAGDKPGPSASETAPDNPHFEIERMLMDADRMMMQLVNLALSLIGFGFSINAFFNDAARRAGGADHDARMFGIFLVVLGLLYLSMGIWTQARYRSELMTLFGAPAGVRALLDGRATPTFLTAFLMLTAGVVALCIMLFRRLF